jgi:hypothetical protein
LWIEEGDKWEKKDLQWDISHEPHYLAKFMLFIHEILDFGEWTGENEEAREDDPHEDARQDAEKVVGF